MNHDSRRPTLGSCDHAVSRIRECGYPVGVFLCHGAALRDTIQLAWIDSIRFLVCESKEHWELVGVYSSEITADGLHEDIRATYDRGRITKPGGDAKLDQRRQERKAA